MTRSVLWDADGPGPLPAKLVVEGEFEVAGGAFAPRIAAWDFGAGTWSALGVSPVPFIRALAVLPNGDLVVAGDPGGVFRWSGLSWLPLGTSGPTTVHSLAVLTTGDLVASTGGAFARWDGTSWSNVAPPVNGVVNAMVPVANGGFIAGGDFSTAGGVAANRVAMWTGTAWVPLAAGLGSGQNDFVATLAVLPSGEVLAGGLFPTCIAKWNGSSWAGLGTGLGDGSWATVRALALLPTGDVVAGGTFSIAGGVPALGLARWNGTAWASFGSGPGVYPVDPSFLPNPGVFTLAVLPGGDLVAGGAFDFVEGVPAKNIARWNGSVWSTVAAGANPAVFEVLELANGDVIAGGTFTMMGGVAANRIARWNGSSWAPLGTGVSGFLATTYVLALAELPGGDIVAGGSFTTAGGVAATGLARWDGTSWAPLGAGLGGPSPALVRAMEVLPSGDLVVGGAFATAGGVASPGVARWNGTTWSPLGAGIAGEVYALATLPNGDVFAGGFFSTFGGAPGNNVARWNGSAWSGLGSGTQSFVGALATLPNGDLVAGGGFTAAGGAPANRIARWNGASWAPMGSGTENTVGAIAVAPGGDVVVGGHFSLANSNRIARWNGTSWQTQGTGPNGSVAALRTFANGHVVAGGAFTAVNGVAAASIAHLAATCPATAQPGGAGCPSSGGSNTLTASLPWTGTTWRAQATGLPGAALVILVTGFATTSLPLVSVFATAQPGCTLHVQPDVVGTTTANAGGASFEFALPNTPSLAGVTFHHQMVPIALDATLAVTATNSLQLTVGRF